MCVEKHGSVWVYSQSCAMAGSSSALLPVRAIAVYECVLAAACEQRCDCPPRHAMQAAAEIDKHAGDPNAHAREDGLLLFNKACRHVPFPVRRRS